MLVIILVALISFGLGRLSKIRENKTPITIENSTSKIRSGASQIGDNDVMFRKFGRRHQMQRKIIVASKNGTKYHYPWCSGAADHKRRK